MKVWIRDETHNFEVEPPWDNLQELDTLYGPDAIVIEIETQADAEWLATQLTWEKHKKTRHAKRPR